MCFLGRILCLRAYNLCPCKTLSRGADSVMDNKCRGKGGQPKKIRHSQARNLTSLLMIDLVKYQNGDRLRTIYSVCSLLRNQFLGSVAWHPTEQLPRIAGKMGEQGKLTTCCLFVSKNKVPNITLHFKHKIDLSFHWLLKCLFHWLRAMITEHYITNFTGINVGSVMLDIGTPK